jgi:hypothetical protein
MGMSTGQTRSRDTMGKVSGLAPEFLASPELLDAVSPSAERGGMLIGSDPFNEPASISLLRPMPTRVIALGGLYLARQLALRALAVGALVIIATGREQAWQALSRATTTGPNERPLPVVSIRLLALCLGDPSNPSPGHMHKQLVAAAALGVRFQPSDAEAPLPGIIQGFASGSDQNAAIAATGGGVEFLYSTTDGGRTWQSTELDEDRFGLADLHFVDHAFGTVITGAPDAWNGSVLYRTTDSGHSWQPVTFS